MSAGSCTACGGERFEAEIAAFDRQVARREDFRYARCAACGLLSLHPMPKDAEIPGFYPDDYAPHAAPPAAPHPGPGRDRPGARERFVARHRFAAGLSRPAGARRRVLHALAGRLARDCMEPRGGHRLLDVGCGAGRLLALHRRLGWEVRGIDPGEHAVAACRAQGLSVQQSGLMEADLPSRHFDAILLHHVIEHVPRPLEALRRARELLAPGGAIRIVTPNAAGLGFRLYGSCWYALDAPRHLHLFDATTLVHLCERAGLSVARVRTVPSARILAASRHHARTQGPVPPPGLAARAAALDRARAPDAASRRFRRLVRPVAQVAAWLGYGETLQATLVDPGRRA